MTRRRKQWLIALSILAFVGFGALLLAHPVLAQSTPADLGLDSQFDTVLTDTDPRIIIGNIIRVFLGFLGILAVGIIMYGGFIWMTAGGREDAVAKAQRIIINGAIGLVIILSAFAITQFVLNTLLDATGADNGVGGSEFG